MKICLIPNVFNTLGALNYAVPPNPLMALGKEAKGAGTTPKPAAMDPFVLQPPPMTDVEMIEGGTTILGKTSHVLNAWWLLKISLIPMSLKALVFIYYPLLI